MQMQMWMLALLSKGAGWWQIQHGMQGMCVGDAVSPWGLGWQGLGGGTAVESAQGENSCFGPHPNSDTSAPIQGPKPLEGSRSSGRACTRVRCKYVHGQGHTTSALGGAGGPPPCSFFTVKNSCFGPHPNSDTSALIQGHKPLDGSWHAFTTCTRVICKCSYGQGHTKPALGGAGGCAHDGPHSEL